MKNNYLYPQTSLCKGFVVQILLYFDCLKEESGETLAAIVSSDTQTSTRLRLSPQQGRTSSVCRLS